VSILQSRLSAILSGLGGNFRVVDVFIKELCLFRHFIELSLHSLQLIAYMNTLTPHFRGLDPHGPKSPAKQQDLQSPNGD
jgi:hypothetical protein